MFNFGAEKVKKSVDGVLTAFREAIADLKEVATEQNAEADAQLKLAQEATDRAAAANAEAIRANTIAAQMAAVFN